MKSSENIFLKDKVNRYIAVKGFIKTCGYGEGYEKRDITVPGVKLLDSKYSEAHPVQFNNCSIPANLMSVLVSSRGIPVGLEKYNVKSAYVVLVKVLAYSLIQSIISSLSSPYSGSTGSIL